MIKIISRAPGDERSAEAFASDLRQTEVLGKRKQVFAVTSVIMVIVLIALSYFGETRTWVMLTVPLFWIGLLIHDNFLLIFHELAEMNDQLAGRKDEFRTLISNQEVNGGKPRREDPQLISERPAT